MSLISVIFIALILSLDCFAVSVAYGIAMKKLRLYDIFITACFFGGFQGGMAYLGWRLGGAIEKIVSNFDHWIAFLLLAAIGIKMVKESFEKNGSAKAVKKIKLDSLISMSVATSIDALAIGLSFAFLKTAILVPALVIGAVSFLMTPAGFYLGGTIGHIFERKAELAGGLVLIGIGLKILIGHLFF